MRASSSFLPLALSICALIACGGSDDGVEFAPGPNAGQGGSGPNEEGGEAGKGGSDIEEPGPGGGGEGGEGGEAGAGVAGKGGGAGKSGASGKGGAPGNAGAAGKGGTGGTGGTGGGSGKGGTGGSSGKGGTGGTGGTGGGTNEVGPENTVARCTDGFDNDGDGHVDCADNDCRAIMPSCREDTLASCSDGLDNDQDGYTDCDDFDCQKDGIGAGCIVSTTCTDEHEPDNELAKATEIAVEEGAGPVCSENHSICASDVDRYRVRFEAFESGGTLDIRLRVFSQASGTVTVKMHDPDGVAPDVVRTLSKMPETLKLLYDTAIVCNGSCGDEVVRELEVSFAGSAKPFYRVCGEMVQTP